MSTQTISGMIGMVGGFLIGGFFYSILYDFCPCPVCLFRKVQELRKEL